MISVHFTLPRLLYIHPKAGTIVPSRTPSSPSSHPLPPSCSISSRYWELGSLPAFTLRMHRINRLLIQKLSWHKMAPGADDDLSLISGSISGWVVTSANHSHVPKMHMINASKNTSCTRWSEREKNLTPSNSQVLRSRQISVIYSVVLMTEDRSLSRTPLTLIRWCDRQYGKIMRLTKAFCCHLMQHIRSYATHNIMNPSSSACYLSAYTLIAMYLHTCKCIPWFAHEYEHTIPVPFLM